MRILSAAFHAENKFSCYVALGIGTLFFTQIVVNINVNVGLAPVTGLVLPFVSYGGSFMLTVMAACGVLQSIYRHRRIEL
jgi:rod shape determining protein RodA